MKRQLVRWASIALALAAPIYLLVGHDVGFDDYSIYIGGFVVVFVLTILWKGR